MSPWAVLIKHQVIGSVVDVVKHEITNSSQKAFTRSYLSHWWCVSLRLISFAECLNRTVFARCTFVAETLQPDSACNTQTLVKWYQSCWNDHTTLSPSTFRQVYKCLSWALILLFLIHVIQMILLVICYKESSGLGSSAPTNAQIMRAPA